MNRGLIIAAPASGSGKTTLTLALLRHLANRGTPVRAAKSGPDYIDPAFHAAACHAPCINLDAWAMAPDRIRSLAQGPGLLLIEGAMGLFDGAPPDGKGAVADLARTLKLPVVLVIDAARMGQSIAPLLAGFTEHDRNVAIAGVILNRVGSDRHERLLRAALSGQPVPVVGIVKRDDRLAIPSRHLGLVQAGERADLETFLDQSAAIISEAVEVDALTGLAADLALVPTKQHQMPPPAQTIALANDKAFAFAYPHMVADWRAAGAEIKPFSPLADEPPPSADLVYLPGGYPELHCRDLANAGRFRKGMQEAAKVSDIYGECGGYMVLGRTLTDAKGVAFPMLGMLDLDTSFADRKLKLGYRHLTATAGAFAGNWAGHEFHYSSTTHASGQPLFKASDSEGIDLAPMGLIDGRVFGSFAHLIDRVV